jgi:hypothetical protein
MKSLFSKNHLILAAGLIASVLSIPSSAFAQLNSGSSSVAITATMAESLTLSTNINAVTFNLVQGGTATGSAPVVITTTWLLQPTRANVEIDGYFASAAALTDGVTPTPDTIPTSAVLGNVTTSSTNATTPTGYAPFTGTTVLGSAGAGLALVNVPLSIANRANTETTTLNLQVNLAGTALAQIPAGTYTGTLTLQAQAL